MSNESDDNPLRFIASIILFLTDFFSFDFSPKKLFDKKNC